VQRFDHEKLDVYQAVVEFVALADDVVENLPRCMSMLVAMVRRDSGSGTGTGTGRGTEEETARDPRDSPA
jgi:hypothetical protein